MQNICVVVVVVVVVIGPREMPNKRWHRKSICYLMATQCVITTHTHMHYSLLWALSPAPRPSIRISIQPSKTKAISVPGIISFHSQLHAHFNVHKLLWHLHKFLWGTREKRFMLKTLSCAIVNWQMKVHFRGLAIALLREHRDVYARQIDKWI